MEKGIIISVQGFSQSTTQELVDSVVSAGAVAIRTDKPIKCRLPIIGLNKIKVNNPEVEPYITNTIELIERVKKWTDLIAIDFRRCNKNLKDIDKYCMENKIKIIADIENFQDFENIQKNNFTVEYITTALSVFKRRFYPDKKLVFKLIQKGYRNIIAEGNYNFRDDVKEVMEKGAHNVCIGNAVSNPYKLTRKYTTLNF